MSSQEQKCATLAALHGAEEAWIIPNPWDAGSARDLEKLGFKAVATSSAACAYTLGTSDGAITLAEKLRHCELIVKATSIPVSVDFEDGFANEPAMVADNIERLVATGVAGCSIEDFSRADKRIFDFNQAVERIQAAVEAVNKLSMPFQLIARADGLIRQHANLEDAQARLLAFEKAGAHVLYAPGLGSLEQVATVAGALNKPLNVLSPLLPGATLAQLGEAGATRISLGNGLLEKVRHQFSRSMETMLSTGAAS